MSTYRDNELVEGIDVKQKDNVRLRDFALWSGLLQLKIALKHLYFKEGTDVKSRECDGCDER